MREKAFPNYNKSKLTNGKEMESQLPLVAIRTHTSMWGGQWRLKVACEVDEDRQPQSPCMSSPCPHALAAKEQRSHSQ